MSSIGLIPPSVSLSDLRAQAAENLENTGSKDTDPGNSAKIQKSAREFEAVLLSHWLEQAEQSFASVPGSNEDPDQDPGKDQFHAIAMQAVGTALTGGHGGLGIAAMVAKHLEAQAAHKNAAVTPVEIKDLHALPDPVKPLALSKVKK
jgi:Rod binding domain-containing protein